MRRLHFSTRLWICAVLALGTLACMVGAGLSSGGMRGWMAGAAVMVALQVFCLASIGRHFLHDVRLLEAAVARAAQGDLGSQMERMRTRDLIGLCRAFGSLMHTLSSMVADVRSNAALVQQDGQHLSADSRQLSQRTRQQADHVGQTVVSVAQITAAVEQSAQSAQTANQQGLSMRGAAQQGMQAMERAGQAVEGIQDKAQRMREIIGVIDAIAFQTNILALNAAVEAARAGEQGRGFAVVASEVRTLAGRSAEAAREIRGLIGDAVQQVGESVERMRAAGEQMQMLVEGIRTMAAHVAEVSASGEDQSQALQSISASVQELDRITQDNARMVEWTTGQAQQLEQRASGLLHAVQRFRLEQGTAEEAVALVERARQLRQQLSGAPFLRALSDPARGFHDRDMYVFALEDDGTYAAFSGQPGKVGTRVQDVPGIDGEELMRRIRAQAQRGPGWVEYEITNPTTGKVQTKISYVCQVDQWYLGCGVYKHLAAAQHHFLAVDEVVQAAADFRTAPQPMEILVVPSAEPARISNRNPLKIPA